MTTKQRKAMQEAKRNTYPKRPVTGIWPGLSEHGRRAKRPLVGKKLG